MKGEGVLARKIRIKSLKRVLLALALLGFGAFVIVQVDSLFYGYTFFRLVAIASMLAGLVALFKGIPALINIQKYKYIRRLPEHVDLSSIGEQYSRVPSENFYRITGSLYYRNKFCIAKDWLIVESFWNLRIYSAGSVLWAYLKTEGVDTQSAAIRSIRTTIYLKTTGSGFSAAGDENSIYDFLHGVNKAYPWVFTDNTRALENLWRDDREKFIQQVNEKKKDFGL